MDITSEKVCSHCDNNNNVVEFFTLREGRNLCEVEVTVRPMRFDERVFSSWSNRLVWNSKHWRITPTIPKREHLFMVGNYHNKLQHLLWLMVAVNLIKLVVVIVSQDRKFLLEYSHLCGSRRKCCLCLRYQPLHTYTNVARAYPCLLLGVPWYHPTNSLPRNGTCVPCQLRLDSVGVHFSFLVNLGENKEGRKRLHF